MHPPHASLAAGGALSRGVFVVAVMFSLAALFAPAGDVPVPPSGFDKLGHLLLFAALAGTGSWAGVRPGVLGVALLVYGGVSEVVQGVPALQRSPSVADWLADAAGVLTGLLAWAWARPRTAR